MPTEAAPDAAAAKARSDANIRGFRLAAGVAGNFALAVLIGWQLSTICTIFVVLFLQAPGPMPRAAMTNLVMQAITFFVISWVLSTALAPYPPAFLIGVALAVATCFYWSTQGAGMLSVVIALMAALMLPNLVLSSQELALVLVVWIPINLVLAWFWTRMMFHFWPPTPPAKPGAAAKPAPPPADPVRRVLRMSLVTIPFAMYFFLIGSGALVTLLFVAILSQQLSAATAAGPTVARGMLKANFYGGLAAICANEITVMAPMLPVAILAFTAAAFILAAWLISARADSSLAGSALTTTVILFGGAIAPYGDDADVAMIDRLYQIGAALAFVLVAYLVVDALLPLIPKEKKPKKRRGLALLRRAPR